jgi:hypothetical protein
MKNLKQALIENIADILDSEDVRCEEVLNGISDPIKREKSELHIRMAEAALAEYKRTCEDRAMELDIEIFDKNRKVLHIGSIISRYLFKLAEKHDKDVEDLLLGIELSQPIRDDGKNIIELVDLDLNRIDKVLCSNGL